MRRQLIHEGFLREWAIFASTPPCDVGGDDEVPPLVPFLGAKRDRVHPYGGMIDREK
jgi:hypothetical protein